MRIEKFNNTNTELFDQAFKIREEVFIGELKIDPSLEYKDEDESAHYLFFDEKDKPFATARFRETSEGYKIERFAVIKTHRNKGFGKIILNVLLEDLIPLNETIYLNAQIEAVDFYLRNGFKTIGDSFIDADVVHFKMVFKTQTNTD